MSTFLILGASSFYGKNFAKCCIEHGDRTYELSRPDFDIDAQGILSDVADYIVDFVARGLVAESWNDPAAWFTTNTLSKIRLFENLRQFKRLKKYVHASTPEVYGNTAMRVKEDYRLNPSTPYAVSKASTDMLLKSYYEAYGFPAVITRTSNIYGLGQPEHRLIPSAFKALREGSELKLHGGGRTRRDFIHVTDACEATYLLAKEGRAGEIYHISTEYERAVSDVIKMIGCKIGTQPLRLGQDYQYLLDAWKLRELGWVHNVELEEGLKCMK